MEKIDKSNTFQLVLDDAVILASDEYKLEDVYSAFKRFFVENGAKDISENPKELVFDNPDYETQKQLYRILNIILYTPFIYRPYLNYVIQYHGKCKFVTDYRMTTQAREMTRMREKAQHDEASALADAESEGRMKERNAMIEALQANGVSEELIQLTLENMK